MKAEQNQNWHLDIDGDNIAWLRIDRSDSSTNTINQAILNELSEKLTALPGSVKGIIIASNKQSGFIAGADIKQFTEFRSADEAMQLINKGQEVFNQLAALTIPTVAMIQGFCLGGGCELALACRYRIAEDGSKTKIGLPEILLGIHPGWGGTVRLPRLVGALNAMDLILTGRAISAKAAAKIGLVDVAVPERHLERAARYYALEQPKPHEPTALQKATNNPLIRPIIGKVLQKKVAQKASPEHYPAPYAVIENWVREGVDNEQQALKVEAESLGQIAVSDTSRNLVRVFFLQERLILRMLNEAVACLREQVVAGSDLLDAGMIFGTGFAPFRGGPIHYAESRRLETMKTQLQQFEERYGERFKPDAGWDGLIVAEQPHTAA
jgi:3-hydroxyacyl-CoA dehydrogenase/enoyl-CoA hydratase/3-hydroxybutyryl-CoA epimerase